MDLMFAGYASTLVIGAAIFTWWTNSADRNPESRWIMFAICLPAMFILFGFELLIYASKTHKEHIRKQIKSGKLSWKYALCTGIVACIAAIAFAAVVGLSGYALEVALAKFEVSQRVRTIVAFSFFGVALLIFSFGPLIGVGWLVSKTKALEQK